MHRPGGGRDLLGGTQWPRGVQAGASGEWEQSGGRGQAAEGLQAVRRPVGFSLGGPGSHREPEDSEGHDPCSKSRTLAARGGIHVLGGAAFKRSEESRTQRKEAGLRVSTASPVFAMQAKGWGGMHSWLYCPFSRMDTQLMEGGSLLCRLS